MDPENVPFVVPLGDHRRIVTCYKEDAVKPCYSPASQANEYLL